MAKKGGNRPSVVRGNNQPRDDQGRFSASGGARAGQRSPASVKRGEKRKAAALRRSALNRPQVSERERKQIRESLPSWQAKHQYWRKHFGGPPSTHTGSREHLDELGRKAHRDEQKAVRDFGAQRRAAAKAEPARALQERLAKAESRVTAAREALASARETDYAEDAARAERRVRRSIARLRVAERDHARIRRKYLKARASAA
jgi:hypothetical protein